MKSVENQMPVNEHCHGSLKNHVKPLSVLVDERNGSVLTHSTRR